MAVTGRPVLNYKLDMNVRKFIEAAAVTIMAALFSWNVRAEEPDPSLRFEVRLGATPPQCSLLSTTRLVNGWGWCGGDTGIGEDYKSVLR